jgi:uncharacterized protein (TIRG00374 family)
MVGLVAAAAASLWLLRSSLGAVYGDLDDMTGIDRRWLLAIVACEAGAFVASWQLNRMALRTRRWFDVAVAQLSGNAASNLVPAGGPAGAAVQLRVLSEAGFDMTRAATSLGALSLLGLAGLLALPVMALLVALVAGAGQGRLDELLWMGAVALVVVIGVTAAFLRRDEPLEAVAVWVQCVRNRLRPRTARFDLPARVLGERDSIRTALRRRPVLVVAATVGRTVLDCAALYLSLLAVGAHPGPLTVVAAFGAANVAGMIPLTPGGLGFVEAGLTGMLVAAGIDPGQAALAAGLYRLASTWLPVVAGVGGYGLFRVRRRAAAHSSAVTSSGASRVRRLVVLGVSAIALVLVSPVLVKVYSHIGRTFTLGPVALTAIGTLIVAHFMSVWALYRVVLRTSNRFDVATSQLAANATSHVAPAGSALGAGLQLRMLTIAGFPGSRAATALGATAVLGTVASYIVLPLGVLLATAAGGHVPASLMGAMWSATSVLGAVLLVAVFVATSDRPWRWAAATVAWIQHRFGRVADGDELGRRLLHERDLIRDVLRRRLGYVIALALLQPLTDYAALLVAVRASGAPVNAAATMAAFVVSNVAGLVPVTPGGLGFVEAGLAHVLTLAGASRGQAHTAIATYRLAATWLPCLAGVVALGLFHHRHRTQRATVNKTENCARTGSASMSPRPDPADPTSPAIPPGPDDHSLHEPARDNVVL